MQMQMNEMRRNTLVKSAGKVSFIATYVFPWPFLIAGIIMLIIGFRGIQSARASTSWPGAEGKITSSEVKQSSSRSTSTKGRSRTSTTYHAKIRYSYSVDGQSHESKRVAFGDYGSSNSSHARGIVAKYPMGTSVKVFHDPDSPGNSVLEPGMKTQALILPGIGVVFTIVGLAMVIFLPKAARRAAKRREEALDMEA